MPMCGGGHHYLPTYGADNGQGETCDGVAILLRHPQLRDGDDDRCGASIIYGPRRFLCG
jgi:hypothetical protein